MKRSLFGAVALAAVAFTVVLIGTASAAKPPPASANGCPQGGTYLVDPKVGADSDGATNRTYTFSSWEDQSPVNGVPGLVGYCVYTNETPTDVTAEYNSWKASKANQTFSFTRPNGEKSNIPLDGTTDILVGSATFTVEPSSETILLHVSDAATCQALYGGDATTCFVLPGPKPGPVCDAAGDTNAAYNAIPKDVEHCSPPSLGFEATQTNEFGDLVTLDTSAGNRVQSMTVDFQSYGCETSGHWNTTDCVTPAVAGTFTVPGGITANIYDPTVSLTVPIATSTINPAIPFRPSAVDDTGCPNNPPADAADSRFIDPVSGNCVYSLSVPLTFPFAGEELPDTVVWTVQFDTSTEGYDPLGSASCSVVNPGDPGCGYDSLNVGVKNYAPDAFAGLDVDNDVAYRSFLGNGDTLAAQSGWAGFRPLGQIVTGP